MAKEAWNQAIKDVDTAINLLQLAVEMFEGRSFADPSLKGYMSKMGLMQSMQMGYTALESGLERTLVICGEHVPDTPDWALDVVQRAAMEMPGRPPIISARTLELCRVLIHFREFVTLHYAEFTKQRAINPVIATKELLQVIKAEHTAFMVLLEAKASAQP